MKKEISTESENRRKRKEENNKNRQEKQKQIHSLYTMTSNKSNNPLKN